MDIAAMSSAADLASLQSCLSLYTMDKAMTQDAASMSALLAGMEQANPIPPAAAGEVGHLMDIRA